MKKKLCYIFILIIAYIFLTKNSTVLAVEMQGGNLSGTLKLSADTELTTTIKVPDNKTLTLDLNGYVLRHSSGERPIVVNTGATLIIKDSNPTRTHYGSISDKLWVYNASATSGVEIKGGIITGGTKSDRGGAIFSKGHVVMNGGTIAGCKSVANTATNETNMQSYPVNTFTNGAGGAIFINENGSFTMNGGTISYCKAVTTSSATLSGGGAVFVDANENAIATFTMNAGAISNCYALNGGAVYIHANLTSGNAVEGAASFSMAGGEISNCQSTGTSTDNGGGAIFVNATSPSNSSKKSIASFNMSGGTLSSNTSQGYGGAVYLLGKFVMSNNASITGCTTQQTTEMVNNKYLYNGLGGAVVVKNDTSSFTMNNGTISNCISASGGAVTLLNNAYFTMAGGNVLNCSASGKMASGEGNGGAVYAEYATFNLNGGTINGCSAFRYGGAINLYIGAKFIMNDGTISNCNAVSAGGIYSYEATTFTINNGKIQNCRAEDSNSNLGNGGAIYLQGCTLNFNNGTLEGNYAKRYGGAININKGAAMTINGSCKILNNTASNGGGIASETDDCQIELDNSNIVIEGNSATGSSSDGNGGGIFIKNGTIDINSCSILRNSATTNGGFIYMMAGTINMNGGSITDSSATNGGAVYMETGSFNMYSGSISDNNATGKGGAVRVNNGSIVIGLKECNGTSNSHSHPKLINNTASDYGGGISISGGQIDIYCALIQGNLHIEGSDYNNVEQNGGVVNVYGGTIDGGISVAAGTFTDYTKGTAQDSKNIKYYSETTPEQTSVAKITAGTELTLLGNVFERDGYYLVGWKLDRNSNEILYVGSVYTVENNANLYAVWSTEQPKASYTVYIPDTIEIDELQRKSVITIEAILKYFTNTASLFVNISDKGNLESGESSVSYSIKDSNNATIENGDVVATFTNNEQTPKKLNVEVTGQPKYAGNYTDKITFNVTYNDGSQ